MKILVSQHRVQIPLNEPLADLLKPREVVFDYPASIVLPDKHLWFGKKPKSAKTGRPQAEKRAKTKACQVYLNSEFDSPFSFTQTHIAKNTFLSREQQGKNDSNIQRGKICRALFFYILSIFYILAS